MITAFVIGNGKSRKAVDLNKLDKYGSTFGCNLLYKEYHPTYITAIDKPIYDEILNSDFPPYKLLPVRYNQRLEVTGSGRDNNTGAIMLQAAVERSFNDIYLLGFDTFFGDHETVFSDDPRYFKISEEASIKRKEYFVEFMKFFPEVKFTLVIPDDVTEVYNAKSPNFFGMYMKDFKEKFQ